NVTVPYKQTIINHLDQLNEQAEKIGAVNTVLHENGQWIGYNTDGIGYVRSLEHAFGDLVASNKTERFLIIEAGGAARGIYVALAPSGMQRIDIASRTVENARKIVKSERQGTSTKVMTIAEAARVLNQYKVIMQTG